MTDRVKGFTVTLEKDVRIDDIESIMTAIQMIKGVINVEPSLVTSVDNISRIRIKSELRDKFIKFIKEEFTF